MKSCAGCGAKLNRSSQFCPKCGKEIPVAQAESLIESRSAGRAPKIILIALALIFMVSSGILTSLVIDGSRNFALIDDEIATQQDLNDELRNKSERASFKYQDARTAQSIAWDRCIQNGVKNLISGRCLGAENISDLEKSASDASSELANGRQREFSLTGERNAMATAAFHENLKWGLVAGLSGLAGLFLAAWRFISKRKLTAQRQPSS